MIKNIFSFAAIAIILTSCSTGYHVIKVTETSKVSKKDGIFYTLPKTEVAVEISINKVMNIKGPYAQFAEKYLNVPDVIKEDNSRFEIANINLRSTTVPDYSQYYFVQFPKCNRHNPINILWDSIGSIASVNAPVGNKENNNKITTFRNLTESEIERYTHPFLTSNLRVDVDTIIESVKEDTAWVEKKRYNKSLKQKSSEQKAKEASEKIFQLRDIRMQLISGEQETAYDQKTLKLMLEELSKEEQSYIELFTGTTLSVPIKTTFRYNPDSLIGVDTLNLYQFSSNEGLISCDSCNETPIKLIVTPANLRTTLSGYVANQQQKSKKKKGFFYRVPQAARFEIFVGEKLYNSNLIPVAQFGVVTTLPNRKKTKIIFDSSAGGVRLVSY